MSAAETLGSSRTEIVAKVLLDSALPQLDHLFDYSVPEELHERIRVGQRVRVPFRSHTRKSHGYVIELTDTSDFTGTLQPIAEIVGPVSVLTPEIYALARALADRAGGSAGDIIRLAIPNRMVRAEKQHLSQVALGSHPTSSVPVTLTAEPTRDEIVSFLADGKRLTITPSHGPIRLKTGEWVGGWALRLAEIALSVYDTGKSVILVAPDYRDTDQLRAVLEDHGHTETVRVDSRQPGSERYAHFLRALDPAPRIILGNRSAVYAPAHKLGAILMWDDGDPVLAEPLTPYVHARDAALIRADQMSTGLLFATHSRSAEIQRLVDLNYVEAELLPPKRTRVLAAVAVSSHDPFPNRVPEFAARLIRENLEIGPVLVQVAAPGYAPITVCQQCGDLARCTHCGGPLAVRNHNSTHAACRWCAERAVGWRCANCSGGSLQVRGYGSERTAEQFTKQFPEARVILSDGTHQVARIDSRPALVVATRGAEPLAPGGYRAVVLLDVERLLSIESLRASEDCLRWWSNAAALAAPDATCVVASGGGPVVRAFVTGRIEEWVQHELQDRKILHYPPSVRVASVTGGHETVTRAITTLEDLAGVEVLGPAPFTPKHSHTSSTKDTPVTSQHAYEPQLQRAIVRFEYGQGGEVAKRLRGALVADAAGASSRVAGRTPRRARPDSLRLRFDDRGVFDA